MVFDRIFNLETYAKGDERLKLIAEFLLEHPSETLADGRYDLPNGIFVNVSVSPTRSDGDYEVHRKYIDLQLILEGDEIIRWAHLSRLNGEPPYDAQNDIQFFSGNQEAGASLRLNAGDFVIFYPQDGHKPLLRLKTEFSRKAVFKIPVKP